MRAKTIVAIVASLILAGPLAAECKANTSFTLTNQDLTIGNNTFYESGSLHGSSNVLVASGGQVGRLIEDDGIISAFDTSTVKVYGGMVYGSIILYNESRLNISDGHVSYINTSYSVTSSVSISGGEVGFYWASSPANISGGLVTTLAGDGTAPITITGGAVTKLYATGVNNVAVSGGQVDRIYASDTSILTFDAQVLSLGEGLYRSGNQVWGSGVLTGEWHDDKSFTTRINLPDDAVVPEPATVVCGLIGLGMIGTYIKKHRASKAWPARS